MADDDIRLQPIPAEQTHALRHRVLRPHQRPDEMVYAGDDLRTTIHLGAFLGRSTTDPPVGIVTLSVEPMPGDAALGDVRLRGMAVDPGVQGRGVGRLLVQRALAEVATTGTRRVWCNARVSAAGFYQRLGFTAHGEAFDIPGIGAHYVMSIAVGG